MLYKFTKMHGCGNDYIYFNCFAGEFPNIPEVAIKLSDRHFSIGGDGIVLILPSDKADAKMRMFNADGSEGKMCGNAIRCVAKYIYDNKIAVKNPITIETLSGIKTLYLTVENDSVVSARVDMGAPILISKDIPVTAETEKFIAENITVNGKDYNVTCVSMGNPHCVTFCDEVASLPLEKIGPPFEKHEMFPEQINTEFVKVIDRNTLEMRVWERGSGETLACGTGACATAVAAVLNGHCDKNSDITVKLIGGDLVINYTDETVFMTGNCIKAFDGEIEF